MHIRKEQATPTRTSDNCYNISSAYKDRSMLPLQRHCCFTQPQRRTNPYPHRPRRPNQPKLTKLRKIISSRNEPQFHHIKTH